MMVTGWAIARKRGYAVERFPGGRELLLRAVAATPGLALVLLIFFGIRSGVFTAVESAAVAVLYALAITVLVYRSLRGAALLGAVMHAARTTGSILFVIAAAGLFGWLLAFLEVPSFAVEMLRGIATEGWMVLLLIVLTLLLLGTFMDLAPLILICTPIFLPVARAFEIAPVHFGIVLILAGGIGLITPPVGSVLFVGAAIGQIEVSKTLRTIWPFYAAATLVLLAVALLPALSLWLPAALK
jgi:tripartite ATP-independent transporter DctM subunit